MIKTAISVVRHTLLALAAMSATLSGTDKASASGYPERYIRIVSMTGAGTPVDEYTRRMARYIGEKLKQTVIIENRPGGNTIVAAEAVATSPPDGYTFLFATSGTVAANPHLFKNLSYNPAKDFVPVARLYSVTMALAVPGTSPFKTVNDLVSAARANPGKLNSATASSVYRILSAALHRAAGIEITDVGYKSAAAVMPDVMTGVIDCAIMEFSSIRPHLESGKLRGLALLTSKRSPMAPNIPTLMEAGLQDSAMVNAITQVLWAGLFAPAGTPPTIVATIERLALEFVNSADAVAFASNQGFMPNAGTAAELTTAIAADRNAWKAMIDIAGLQPQ